MSGLRGCLPLEGPPMGRVHGKVVKCDGCLDRVEEGLHPACVAGCTTHALSFFRPNENVRKVRTLYAKSLLVKKNEG